MQNENIAKPEEGTNQDATTEVATMQEPTTELKTVEAKNHDTDSAQPKLTDSMQKDRMTGEGSKVTPAVSGIGLPTVNTAPHSASGTTGK